jgi:hypothetical protein
MQTSNGLLTKVLKRAKLIFFLSSVIKSIMGCIFSKKQEILLTKPDIVSYININETNNCIYTNPIHSDSDLNEKIVI